METLMKSDGKIQWPSSSVIVGHRLLWLSVCPCVKLGACDDVVACIDG